MYMDPILNCTLRIKLSDLCAIPKGQNPCKGCHLRSTRKSEICILKNCKSLSKTDPKLVLAVPPFPAAGSTV